MSNVPTVTTTYHDVVDRTGWPEGPWMHEPDKATWVDPETDLDCMIHRSTYLGALCGYVGVPEGHPWFGRHYHDIDASVHGGLTYADVCQDTDDEATGICHVPQPGRPAHVWWVGFDCGHAFDYQPGFAARYNDVQRDSTYRDWDYVVAEVHDLARQAAAAKEG